MFQDEKRNSKNMQSYTFVAIATTFVLLTQIAVLVILVCITGKTSCLNKEGERKKEKQDLPEQPNTGVTQTLDTDE